jgi:multiple sugar transport system permease protein
MIAYAERRIGIRIARKAAFALILCIILLVVLFPIMWLILASFKNYVDVFAMPPKLFFKPTLANYYAVFIGKQIQRFAINSVIVTSTSTLFALIIGVPGAYSLSQFDFRGKKNLRFFILSIRIAPPVMSVFPLFVIFNRMNLLGTRLSMIIMYVVFNLPLAVWIMQVFFEDISRELREAAIVDGCSEVRVFWSIMLPLVRSGLAATAILCVIQSWNEYLMALVLSGSATQTLPVAISSFMTYQGIEWGPISAAAVVVMVPMIVFGLSVQKNLARGMTLGAIKG